MGNCSSTSNCNPCGPDLSAINQLATKAGAYARQANTYATNAENSWLEFNALYLGAFAVAPTVDNEGDPLQTGALYWNTGSNTLYAWNGTAWAVATNFNEFTPFLATGTTIARNLVTRMADVVNVKDFGAVGNGVADDSTAIQAAVNTGKDIFFPEGNYKTDTAITGLGRSFGFGASFSGTNPIDIYPAFGTGAFKTISCNFNNGIIGIVDNKLPSSTVAFPTGVTGYGKNNNNGNTAFGIYAEARQYANTGVVTNEIDSFNHGAAPSANLPPDRSIGTTQQVPVALTVAAGGTANSSIAIEIGREGSSPQKFLTGIYLQPDSYVNYGIFLDANASSTAEPLVVKHSVNKPAINVVGQGAPVAANAWISYSDQSSNAIFSIKQSGACSYNTSITQATVGVAGTASALPALPEGYLKIEVGGLTKIIPYYNP
jgi:hypothetical protein